MTVNVTAFHESAVMEYTLHYAGNGTEGTAEVLAPESVAGLLLEIREEDGTLICGDISLETGRNGAAGITPAGICPVLWSILTEGYAAQCRYETRDDAETLAVLLEGEEGLFLEVWFDKETLHPVYCTVMENGVQALSCTFEEVTICA
ncbi:MAG: hypothetical protein IJC35_07210 [Oscillospiraceae bacterium]|nr:hypothetical protein [Oscillospiraceae bacterium]